MSIASCKGQYTKLKAKIKPVWCKPNRLASAPSALAGSTTRRLHQLTKGTPPQHRGYVLMRRLIAAIALRDLFRKTFAQDGGQVFGHEACAL